MPEPVRSRYRVIYGDTDQMGVVYYANYLRFAEHGRNEFIRAKGLPYRDIEDRFHLRLPVVEAHLDYQASARYDDLLAIDTWVEQLRRASLRFAYRISRDGEAGGFVAGFTVHACIDPAGRPVRIPEEIAALLR